MTPEPGNLNEDSFLTVAEVAELLKLNQQTVRNWIDRGSLPALRVGRRVRIRQSDLNRVLEEGSTRRAPAAHGDGPSAEDFWGGEPFGHADPPNNDDRGGGHAGDRGDGDADDRDNSDDRGDGHERAPE